MVTSLPSVPASLSSGVALHRPGLQLWGLFILVASWWGRIVYRTGLNGTTSSSLSVDYTLRCSVGFAAWLVSAVDPGPLRIPVSQTEAGPLTTAPLAVVGLALMWAAGLLSKAGSGPASQAVWLWYAAMGWQALLARSCQTSWIWMGWWYEIICLYVEGAGRGGGTYGHLHPHAAVISSIWPRYRFYCWGYVGASFCVWMLKYLTFYWVFFMPCAFQRQISF